MANFECERAVRWPREHLVLGGPVAEWGATGRWFRKADFGPKPKRTFS